jgi:hypothetical protein
MPCECRSAPSGEFERDRCGRRAHRRTLYVGQRMQEIGEPVLHRPRLELTRLVFYGNQIGRIDGATPNSLVAWALI